MQNTTERDAAIEHEVKALLERGAAWRALPQAEQTQMARDMVKVAVGLVDEKRSEMGGDAAAVEIPGFVAGVVQGVFQAIVDASAQQMKAYGELLAWIAGPSSSSRRRTPSAESRVASRTCSRRWSWRASTGSS